MHSRKIDLLNILLIILSLLLAFEIPFELFLFSYAVLGPLHYLTEINWLHEKNYFLRNKYWSYALVLFAALISISSIRKLPYFRAFFEAYISGPILGLFDSYGSPLLLCSFLFSIGLVTYKKTAHILAFSGVALVSSFLLLKFAPFSIVLVGGFLPTIIHVYFFTLLFMALGFLTEKNGYSLFAVISLLLCPMLILASNIVPSSYYLSDGTKSAFLESGFPDLIVFLGGYFGQVETGSFNLMSTIGLKIQIFLGFAYTYHYLNWFSKTSVIGWARKISGFQCILIGSIWISSMLLYWYDYKTGMMALFFLSTLHVLLEFPLNISVIKEISSRIRGGQK